MSEYNYREDLGIDPDALDVEWMRQPELYMKYCELSADAKIVAARADERVKIVRSELLLEAREQGAKNAGQEEAYYRTHHRHIEAKEAWLVAQRNADILFAAQFAFNQRKDALENLVKLAGMGYFASPTGGDRNLGDAIAQRKSTARSVATERLAGRRRGRRQE